MGGSTNGVTDDSVHNIDASVKTIVDLLEAEGISWAEYQEDIPSTGSDVAVNIDPVTHKQNYVRKHK